MQYGSQFADPRRETAYWQNWREFEESHGNEDTFREMLRVQRSVETSYSQMNYLAAEMLAGQGGNFVPASNSTAAASASASVSSALPPAAPLTMDEMARLAEQEALEEANGGGGGALKGFVVGANQGKRKFVPSEGDQEEGQEEGLQLKRQNLKNDDEIDI